VRAVDVVTEALPAGTETYRRARAAEVVAALIDAGFDVEQGTIDAKVYRQGFRDGWNDACAEMARRGV
jgi:hypothetical protein